MNVLKEKNTLENMDQDGVLFEILAGTYEEFTVGYECIRYGKDLKLKHTIATHSHRASLKTIAAYNGPKHDLLVTGGTDETVHIYDLRCRKESGILINHSGTVTCLRFTPDGSHLMSAGEDGAINIYKVGSWFLEKTWPKAHKGLGVIYLSIHPTGKLALSIGNDKTLRTWNLVKGRPAYTINLVGKVKQPEIVEWSMCGQYYGLVDEETLNLYTLDKAGIVHSIKGKSRITNICFIKDGRVCIGDWAGSLTCYTFKAEKIWEIKEGEMRLKTINFFDNYLISIDGQGKIFVYDTSKEGKPRKKATFETSCRITCAAISKLLSEEERPPKKKKKLLPLIDAVVKEEDEIKVPVTPKQKRKSKDAVGTPQQQWSVSESTP